VNELLLEIGERQTAAFVLVLGRVGPLFVLGPLFALRMIPIRVRVIVAVALAVGLAPVALGDGRVPTDMAPFVELLLKEILVGLAFAFAIGVVIYALQVAGAFLDLFMGFSLGGLVDPLTGVNSTVIAQFYAMLGLLVFVAIGGEAFVIQGLARTYDVVPLADMPSLASLVGTVDHAFVNLFRSALEVVAPVLIAVTITDAAFGIVTRVVPQLNVLSVGFPAKIAVGLVVLAASLPFLGGWLGEHLESAMRAALGGLSQ
jgi:flagellar biosynthesis protein FliR